MHLCQVGFLFLRYVGDPKTLWNWFQNYVNDDEVYSAMLGPLFLPLVSKVWIYMPGKMRKGSTELSYARINAAIVCL